MDSIVGNLMLLGLKEYEARIYVALVGIGEANARRIHEASGVPRPRVYDILQSLAQRGCIEVRQGSPLQYLAVRPDVVVAHLKSRLDQAAVESVDALESISLDAGQQYTPIWYVTGDWSIDRHVAALLEGVADTLLVLALHPGVVERYAEQVTAVGSALTVKVLYPADGGRSARSIPGVSSYQIGEICDYFRENILEKVFAAPITRDGATFSLDCILLADERESMLIYAQNGERMAVIITLPFITCVQSTFFNQMLAHARPLGGAAAR
jgi:sugar-specific transcriptional regulator TrmB